MEQKEKNEKQVERRIARSFAIAAKAVTVKEFQKFRPEHEYNKQYANNKPNCPMNTVTWYGAAAYCNWLSDREGLEAVYEPNEDKEYGPGMKLKATLPATEWLSLTYGVGMGICLSGGGGDKPVLW